MLESIASKADPFVFLLTVLPLTLIALAVAYRLTVRYGKEGDEKEAAAFSLGQAAVFGLVALILGFSFSFAAERFEARRALLVNEADAIGTSYLRADFLPATQRTHFRKTIIDYTKTRLTIYSEITMARDTSASVGQSQEQQGELWKIASNAANSDPHNLSYASIASSVNETIDVSEQQTAAIDNHVPAAMMALVLLSTIAGAVVLGMTFGRAKSPSYLLSIVFSLLFASTVYAIVDLDNSQGGLIRLNTAPLQTTLSDMKP